MSWPFLRTFSISALWALVAQGVRVGDEDDADVNVSAAPVPDAKAASIVIQATNDGSAYVPVVSNGADGAVSKASDAVQKLKAAEEAISSYKGIAATTVATPQSNTAAADSLAEHDGLMEAHAMENTTMEALAAPQSGSTSSCIDGKEWEDFCTRNTDIICTPTNLLNRYCSRTCCVIKGKCNEEGYHLLCDGCECNELEVMTAPKDFQIEGLSVSGKIADLFYQVSKPLVSVTAGVASIELNRTRLGELVGLTQEQALARTGKGPPQAVLAEVRSSATSRRLTPV